VYSIVINIQKKDDRSFEEGLLLDFRVKYNWSFINSVIMCIKFSSFIEFVIEGDGPTHESEDIWCMLSEESYLHIDLILIEWR